MTHSDNIYQLCKEIETDINSLVGRLRYTNQVQHLTRLIDLRVFIDEPRNPDFNKMDEVNFRYDRVYRAALECQFSYVNLPIVIRIRTKLDDIIMYRNQLNEIRDKDRQELEMVRSFENDHNSGVRMPIAMYDIYQLFTQHHSRYYSNKPKPTINRVAYYLGISKNSYIRNAALSYQ